MGSNSSTIAEIIAAVPQESFYPFVIGMIAVYLFMAFFSFRFLKISIVISGLTLGYSFGAVSLGMLLGDRITTFNAPLVLGITCAVAFAILAPKFYKACIYIFGGLLGFAFGYSFFAGFLTGLGNASSGAMLGIPVGVLLAIVGAKLVYRIFKPFFIIISAFAGSMLAALITSYLIFGDSGLATTLFTVVGLALTAVSMIAQFRMNTDRDLDL